MKRVNQADLSVVPDISISTESLYYQVPSWAAKKAIAAKLTGADWCVWSYLQMLDPYGDRLVPTPPPEEIAKEINFSEKQVKRSLAKLEEMGFWEFKVLAWKSRNLATPKKKDRIVREKTELSEPGQDCLVADRFVQTRTDLSEIRQDCPNQGLEPAPSKDSKTLQTYSDLNQTYSDLNQTYSESPLTPQGESERGGNREALNFSQEEPKPEPEPTAISPSPQTESKTLTCQPESLDPEIKQPPARENDSRFMPTDTTAENMTAWKEIMATGAMKGASHPDPEFLEFYRAILSKCSHYKGRDCNTNHAKAALKKLWQQEPLRVLAEAENWVASKTKFAKSTQARNVKDLSDEEKAAVLQRVIDRRKQQQATGA